MLAGMLVGQNAAAQEELAQQTGAPLFALHSNLLHLTTVSPALTGTSWLHVVVPSTTTMQANTTNDRTCMAHCGYRWSYSPLIEPVLAAWTNTHAR